MTRTLLTVTLSIWITTAFTQRIVVYLDNVPTTTPSVSKAVLRYDKDFAYSLTLDDGANDAYKCALPALQGGFVAGNNTTYSGLFFTDGCGNSLPFRAGIAWNAANAIGVDNHQGNVAGVLTWTQLDELYDKGWDVFNHSFTHKAQAVATMTPADYIYQVNQNLIETRNKTRNRIEMPVFVVPSGDNNYHSVAYAQGQKIVLNQTANTIGIGGLSVATDINFNGQAVHRTEINQQINSGANQVGTVANRSASGDRIWYNEFTHHIDNFGASAGLSFYAFRAHVERIATNWGKNGTDKIWVAPIQEVTEYLTMRQTATYTATLNGNQLTIDFNLQNVPTWLRRRPLTLIVNGNTTFSRVDVSQGVKMTFKGTGSKKIINLDLAGAAAGATDPCTTDSTPPVFTNCPQNINLTTSGTSAVANWTPPTATDNCTTPPSVSSNFAQASDFPLGTTTVNYTATDAKNNRATCSFTITVTRTSIDSCASDVTPPLIKNCPQNITVTTTGVSMPVTWTAPIITDNCTTALILTRNFDRGSTFPLGTTLVIYTATDAKNNKSTCSFNVTVTQGGVDSCLNDEIPPVLNNCPTNMNLTTTGNDVAAFWTAPTATDNCSSPPVISNFPSGALFPIGTTAVIFVAVDNQSNRSTCGFNVIVTELDDLCLADIVPPVLRNCPQNRLITTTNASEIVTWTPPTATDNCTGTPTISSNFTSGQSFPIGSTTVTYAATDDKGNRSTCNFTITVVNLVIGEICTAKADTPWYEWVSRVQFNTLNNFSEKTRPERYFVGYSNWLDKSTTVGVDKTYTLSITATESYKYGTTILYYRAWIDFNGNGVFDANEKVLEQSNNGQSTAVQQVRIPQSSILDTVRMRIAMKKGSYPMPCETFTFGEVEDYSIIINSSGNSGQNLVQLRPTQLIPIVINKILPNPTEGDVFIKLESLDNRTVRFDFFNAIGKLVKSESQKLEKGMNTIGFDFSTAPQGVYFIQTDVNKGRNVPIKFIKM